MGSKALLPSQRRVGWPMGAAGRVRLPRFLIMRVRGGLGFGRACTRCAWFNEERRKKMPSPAARPGEGERGTVSFKTTLFYLFLFFLHETVSFYTKRVVSFKGGASICFPNQSLIYPLFF
jgi:hypothetical protein